MVVPSVKSPRIAVAWCLKALVLAGPMGLAEVAAFRVSERGTLEVLAYAALCGVIVALVQHDRSILHTATYLMIGVVSAGYGWALAAVLSIGPLGIGMVGLVGAAALAALLLSLRTWRVWRLETLLLRAGLLVTVGWSAWVATVVAPASEHPLEAAAIMGAIPVCTAALAGAAVLLEREERRR
jgi:hypothetical protein